MFVFWSTVKRPARPTRPSLPQPLKPLTVDDARPKELPLESNIVLNTSSPAHLQYCDLLTQLCSPLTSDSDAQTEPSLEAAVAAAPPQVPQERPRPRPRSRLSAPPTCSEVRVQTLVKLREDGLATLAARSEASQAHEQASQGRYLQELLDAFSGDDWGFPERHSDDSECSQSESEQDDEREEEDMATLRARIQVFEQQPVSDGSCGSSSNEDVENTKRPEPRPRPRLQLQSAKSPPPTIAPKPKNFPHAPKPSTKLFWETADSTPAASDSCRSDRLETAGALQATNENTPSLTTTSCTNSTQQPCRETEKPSLSLKPSPEVLLSDTSVPVPAPRPPPPKAEPQLRPPPRPAAAPRLNGGPAQQEKEATPGIPALPPRGDKTQDAGNATGKCFLPLTVAVFADIGTLLRGFTHNTHNLKSNCGSTSLESHICFLSDNGANNQECEPVSHQSENISSHMWSVVCCRSYCN